MQKIKSISDLLNYSDALQDAAVDDPDFLINDEFGRYANPDMQDFETVLATIQLMNGLTKDRKSSEEENWLTLGSLEKRLKIVNE